MKLLSLIILGGFFAATAHADNPSCEHTTGFSRSDHGSQEYHRVVVKGSPNDTFAFQGCSVSYEAGKRCVSK